MNITDAEMEIMRIVWDSGEKVTTRDIMENLPGSCSANSCQSSSAVDSSGHRTMDVGHLDGGCCLDGWQIPVGLFQV